MDLVSFIAPLTVGGAMVLLIDGIRWAFPTLDAKVVKIVTIALAVLFAVIIFLAQTNTSIEQALGIFLQVLGSSQLLYGLVWKSTTVHQNIVKAGDNPTE